MNEEELKQIWRKEEAIPLKNTDMEFIQQYTLNTRNTMQKLSRNEIIVGLIASAIFVFDFINSANFYFVLAAAALLWILFFWSKRRGEKADEINRTENAKNYLIGKVRKLKIEMFLYRILTFAGVSIFAFKVKQINDSYPDIDSTLPHIIFLIVAVVLIQIGCEFFIRFNYYPILEDLRYLIEELDGENDNSK